MTQSRAADEVWIASLRSRCLDCVASLAMTTRLSSKPDCEDHPKDHQQKDARQKGREAQAQRI